MSDDISVVERFLGKTEDTRVVIAEFQDKPPQRNRALSLMGSTLRELFTGLCIDPNAVKAELVEFTSAENIVHPLVLGAVDALSLSDDWLSPDSKVWRLNWQLPDTHDGAHPSAASVVFAEAGKHEQAGFNILTASKDPTIEPHELLQGFIKRYSSEDLSLAD